MNTTIRISKEIAKQIKLLALQNDVSVQEQAEKMLSAYLSKPAKKEKKK